MKYIVRLAVIVLMVPAIQPINAQNMNQKITTFLMFESDAAWRLRIFNEVRVGAGPVRSLLAVKLW